MANKDFLAAIRVYIPLVCVPLAFYDTYGATLPDTVTMEDQFGNTYYGQMFKHTEKLVYLHTDVKKLLRACSYKRFAIVRLTYKSKGNFNLFVPDSTDYWKQHSPIPNLLPYAYEGTIGWDDDFDCVGSYECDTFVNHDANNEAEIDAYENHTFTQYNSSASDSDDRRYIPLLPTDFEGSAAYSRSSDEDTD